MLETQVGESEAERKAEFAYAKNVLSKLVDQVDYHTL